MLNNAFKAFPRGKVAAGAFPTTDEGAFDFLVFRFDVCKNAKTKSKAPLIRQSKNMFCHLLGVTTSRFA